MNDEITLNEGEVAQTDSLPVKEPTLEPAVPAEPAEPTGEEKAVEAKDEGVKKDANQRIRELVKEKNEAKRKAESLAEQMAKLTDSMSAGNDYTPQPVAPVSEQEDSTITREQYELDVMRKADALVQLRLKQQETIARVNRESAEAIAKYRQLDPDAEEFDAELSESIAEATLSYVKTNPTEGVKKFVDKLMKPYMRSLEKEVGKVTENVAKQVSEAALRPTSHREVERKPEDLSLSELEKRLGGIVQS